MNSSGKTVQKHVFTHYVPLSAIIKAIGFLDAVAGIVEQHYNGKIKKENTDKINAQNFAYGNLIASSNFIKVLRDCWYVERFDIDRVSEKVQDARIITIYPVSYTHLGGTQMKRIIPFLLALFLLTGCGGTAAGDAYQQITQEEAKEMMDTQEVIILDVREQDEYDSGHIPGAVLLPVCTSDETTAAEVIPEKDSTVLVYCRSGNRRKTASAALAELGYTGIYEFGGINTWHYEIES